MPKQFFFTQPSTSAKSTACKLGWLAVQLLLCLPTAHAAGGVKTHLAPVGLPVGVVTTVPVTLENPALGTSRRGYLEVNRFHSLAGTSIATCSVLIIKLIEMPFGQAADPIESALFTAAFSAGLSIGLRISELAFPESSPLISTVRFISKRRQMYGQYEIQFETPEMRTAVRENLQQLGDKRFEGVEVKAVLRFDEKWVCQEARLYVWSQEIDLTGSRFPFGD